MLWLVSELYAPEHVSTGHFVTGIAEGLASSRPVGVICSQPTYAARGTRAPSREMRNGVAVFRVTPPALNKNAIVSRILLSVSVSWLLFIQMMRKLRNGDHVIVVTNPPFLPYLAAIACGLRGANYSVLVHDVYPDVLTAVGFIRAGGFIERTIGRAVRALYDGAAKVIVLGRDMAVHAAARVSDAAKVVVIPNWGDDDIVRPERRDVDAPFTIQYLGNIGRTHDIETLIEAAALTTSSDVRWSFIGDGAKLPLVEASIRTGKTPNISARGRVSQEELSRTLGDCDVAIVSFIRGMAGISVPSRVYNIMCAGRPIIAVADRESEVAGLIAEHHIGWVVPPGDSGSLVRAVTSVRADAEARVESGARARRLAEACYTRAAVVAQYERMLESLQSIPETRTCR